MANPRTLSVTQIMDKAELTAFTERTDGPGLAFLAAHLGLLALGAVAIDAAWGTWWLVPAMVLHGIVVVHLFAPLHECTHYTAFRSKWLNRAVGVATGFAIGVPFLFFRLEHVAHHRFTQDPVHDPERIPLADSRFGHWWYVTTIPYWKNLVGDLARHAADRYRPEELAFLRPEQVRLVTLEARLMIAGYALILLASVATGSWAAAVYWLVPRILGEPFMRVIRMSEHVGCDPGLDMLRNTRTVAHAVGPVRWLAWNMCWHTAHHYLPGVPFFRLAGFDRRIRDHVDHVSPGYVAAHREILERVDGRTAGAGGAAA